MQAQGEMTPLRELKRPQPMVFAGVYPFDGGEHAKLKSAIEKVCLNDFSVTLTTESSMAMGLGWRVGFLGLLHMEVRQASFCLTLLLIPLHVLAPKLKDSFCENSTTGKGSNTEFASLEI